jgi:hypothetical protein
LQTFSGGGPRSFQPALHAQYWGDVDNRWPSANRSFSCSDRLDANPPDRTESLERDPVEQCHEVLVHAPGRKRRPLAASSAFTFAGTSDLSGV